MLTITKAQSNKDDDNEEAIAFSALPDNIKDAYNSSEYAEWHVEEVEKAPSPIGTKYEIEVKNENGDHLGLYFDRKGELFRKEDETKKEEEVSNEDDD